LKEFKDRFIEQVRGLLKHKEEIRE